MKLRGITWNHSRGYLPMVATAQRFVEIHPGVEIVWEKRSLQAFADYPIQKLAEMFDLLVIDHPFVGYAAAHPVLLPLDEWLPKTFLTDQAQHSVGRSHESYRYGGHQWALAIDAATPVSACRPDVLRKARARVPRTWDELMALARRGLVAVPSIPVDAIMNFFMLCATQGEEPCAARDKIISEETGVRRLQQLRDLVSACAPECLKRNPIATYEAMCVRDDIGYCPFAYGYSNYARDGYARETLQFGGLVTLGSHGRLRSTLGGTGLAISARCRHREVAAEYARYVAGGECQRTLYVQSGGQPGHRGAWLDDEVNRGSHNYFRRTLQTLDEAYLRPRYDGYLHLQDHGGAIVHKFLQRGGDPRQTLSRLNQLYQQSMNTSDPSEPSPERRAGKTSSASPNPSGIRGGTSSASPTRESTNERPLEGRAPRARIRQESVEGRAPRVPIPRKSVEGRAPRVPSDLPPQRKHPAHPSPIIQVNQSTIVFVTVCVAKRRPLLASEQAHQLICQAWSEAAAWRVGRYVIMPDHVHFFCAPFDDHFALKNWMSFWRNWVTRAWPRSEEKPIWQKDYWDTQLRRGENYSAKWDYVRQNPVRAGLTTHAEEWPYQGEFHVLSW